MLGKKYIHINYQIQAANRKYPHNQLFSKITRALLIKHELICHCSKKQHIVPFLREGSDFNLGISHHTISATEVLPPSCGGRSPIPMCLSTQEKLAGSWCEG